jgi:hypothetical protein
VADALRLYTLGTAALNGDAGRLGSITPGKLADLAGYPADPLTADPDDLAVLTPALTVVGGTPVHDPDKRLARDGTGRAVGGPGRGGRSAPSSRGPGFASPIIAHQLPCNGCGAVIAGKH